MTTIEHYMLYICFGAMTGWTISSLTFLIIDAVYSIKKKIKARREKKQRDSIKNNNE